MILRRIAVSRKRQDWATALIEFALVILGALIALTPTIAAETVSYEARYLGQTPPGPAPD